MKRVLFNMVLAVMVFGLYSCNKDGQNVANLQAEAALLAKYPAATNVRWQVKTTYFVADFQLPETKAVHMLDHSAWFDNGGKWYMTETDIPFEALPQTVKEAFHTGEYASWRVDDVDKLEREGVETVYVIETEGAVNGVKTEIDLYYSPDGVLLKKVVDSGKDYDYHDYIPSSAPGNIAEFIEQKYPGARIVDIERESGMTEVEIIDNKICRELLFDASNNWIYTKTEIRKSEVPASIMQVLTASEYGSYRIDDIDYYDTPDKDFYRFDLESVQGDVKVDITTGGALAVVKYEPSKPGGNSNGSILNETVKNFIMEKYPNAVIREYDYDNGLLEVEIYHENKEKDVYFNGKSEWVKTEWEIRKTDLPEAVTTAIANSQYASYKIDDVDYIQMPANEYYLIELESGNREVKLRITGTGSIL